MRLVMRYLAIGKIPSSIITIQIQMRKRRKSGCEGSAISWYAYCLCDKNIQEKLFKAYNHDSPVQNSLKRYTPSWLNRCMRKIKLLLDFASFFIYSTFNIKEVLNFLMFDNSSNKDLYCLINWEFLLKCESILSALSLAFIFSSMESMHLIASQFLLSQWTVQSMKSWSTSISSLKSLIILQLLVCKLFSVTWYSPIFFIKSLNSLNLLSFRQFQSNNQNTSRSSISKSSTSKRCRISPKNYKGCLWMSTLGIRSWIPYPSSKSITHASLSSKSFSSLY